MEANIRDRILQLNPWFVSPAVFPDFVRSRLPERYIPRRLGWEPDLLPRRALLLVGPRQVGKTTFLWSRLQDRPPEQVLYLSGEEPMVQSWTGSATGFLADLQTSFPSVRTLFIDEAQNLNPEALESLRMLSNINADKDQLLQIVLLGQPQLKTLLRRPELQQFAQRISVDFHLQRLCDAEVGLYVIHRLKVAGRETPLFSHEALMRIAEVSGGIPRSINILCDTALVYGFSLGIERIARRVIDEVISDKQKYGIFNAPVPPDGEGLPPAQARKPALVIYDRELAKELIEKMQREKGDS